MTNPNSTHTKAATSTYLLPPALFAEVTYSWPHPRVYSFKQTGQSVIVAPVGEEAWFRLADVVGLLGEPLHDPATTSGVRLRSRNITPGAPSDTMAGDSALRACWKGLTGVQLHAFRWLRAISVAISCERAERRLRERGYYVEAPEGYAFPAFSYLADAVPAYNVPKVLVS